MERVIQEPLPAWPNPTTAFALIPEMVHRVARVLADHPHASSLELARFAIAAMREPTEEMMVASMAPAGQMMIDDIWRTMVDEALR